MLMITNTIIDNIHTFDHESFHIYKFVLHLYSDKKRNIFFKSLVVSLIQSGKKNYIYIYIYFYSIIIILFLFNVQINIQS